MNKPRPLALVKFNFDALPKERHKDYDVFKYRTLLFLGEIPNMPGHCVVVDTTQPHNLEINPRFGKIYPGYHTENFMELSDEEV